MIFIPHVWCFDPPLVLNFISLAQYSSLAFYLCLNENHCINMLFVMILYFDHYHEFQPLRMVFLICRELIWRGLKLGSGARNQLCKILCHALLAWTCYNDLSITLSFQVQMNQLRCPFIRQQKDLQLSCRYQGLIRRIWGLKVIKTVNFT